MKPTIGRIMHYHCTEEERKMLNNQQFIAPAIITAVWGDECVNLKVLFDGLHTEWRTSITMGDSDYHWTWPTIEN